jgi:hypothetical protein
VRWITFDLSSSDQTFLDLIQRKTFSGRGPAVQVFSKPHSGVGSVDWLADKIEDIDYQPVEMDVVRSIVTPNGLLLDQQIGPRPWYDADHAFYWVNKKRKFYPYRCPECAAPQDKSGLCKRPECIRARRFPTAVSTLLWVPDFSVRLDQDNRLRVPWKNLDLDKLRTQTSFLNPDRFATLPKLRLVPFEGVSRSERCHRLCPDGVPIPDQSFDDLNLEIYETSECIRVGHLSSANTSSLVARSIRYFGPEETSPAKILGGSFYRTVRDQHGFRVEEIPFLHFAPVAIEPAADLHDRMTAQLRAYEESISTESQNVIEANIATIEFEIQNGYESWYDDYNDLWYDRKDGAEFTRALREEYDRWVEEQTWAATRWDEEKIRKSKAGHCVCKPESLRVALWKKPDYVSPHSNWVKFHSDISKMKFYSHTLEVEIDCHKPNYGTFCRDAFKGNEFDQGGGRSATWNSKKLRKELDDEATRLTGIPVAVNTKLEKGFDSDLEASDIDEQVEDFEEQEGNFGESQSESSYDPRFTDDEEESGRPEGCDWIERVKDGRDATRQTEDPPSHEDLQALRNLVVAKPDPVKNPVVLEMVIKGRTAEEVAAKYNVNPKTAQTWKDRTMDKAQMLVIRPDGRPNIPVTDEMLDVAVGGGAYVLVNLGNGWGYQPLDVEKHNKLDQAIAALKEDKICAAWKDSDVCKKTIKRYRSLLKGGRLIELAQIQEYRRRERAKIVDRINRCFEQIYTFPDRQKGSERHAMLLQTKDLEET